MDEALTDYFNFESERRLGGLINPLRSESSTEQDSAYGSPHSNELSLSPSSPPLPVDCKMPAPTLCSIICSCCRNTYIDPKVLPCLDTFCASCIVSNQVKNDKIICPTCHSEFDWPMTGTSGLLPDFGIIHFMNSLKGNVHCTSCKSPERSNAVAKCIDCDNFLCKNCVKAHSYMLCFDGHRIIEFPNDFFVDDAPVTDSGKVTCLSHPDESIYHFCFSCNEPICSVCLTGKHLDHKIELIDSIGSELLLVMCSAIEDNQLKLSEVKCGLKSAKQTELWLKTQYEDINSKINGYYNHFQALLSKHRQQQLAILEGYYSRMKSALRNSTNISQEAYEKLSKVTDFCTRLSKFSNLTELLMFKKLLDTKNTRVSGFRPKLSGCNLKFVGDGRDFASVLHNTFGHVTCDLNGIDQEFGDDKFPQVFSSAHTYLSTFQLADKYDKWSNTCFDDFKLLTDCGINDDIPLGRPFHSLKSSVSRMVISYNWKFGSYGTNQGQFTEPNGVATNADGDIIIADTNNNRVQVFDKLGRFQFLFGEGSCIKDSRNLLFPNRVSVMEVTGDIVVTERAPTHQVQIYSQYGQFIRKFGANILQHPRAVAVDKEGHIIVIECKVMRVIIFNSNGEVLQKFTCNNTLHFPNGVAVNDKHQIFISDNRTHCVVVYDYSGNFIRSIGQEGLTNYPIGVMIDSLGQVIVADNHNNFNLTVFTQEGELVKAFESKVKHAQCYDAAISYDGTVVLTSKDFKVYVYHTNF